MPYRKIEQYKDAFDLISAPLNEAAKRKLKLLEREGRTEKSICFAIWKSQEKLRKYRSDSRFWSVFENEIRKWSWSRNDPRWDDYNKRKSEELKLQQQKEAESIKFKEKQHASSVLFLYKQRYTGYIYFIQGETGGPIKIGYSDDVKKRLKGLQTGHPDSLIVLFSYPGSMDDEKAIHAQLSTYKLRGEWFKPTCEVFEFIEAMKKKPLPQLSEFEFD